MSWSALHSDLLLKIFSLLLPRDLLSAGLVCRSWFRIANSASLWYTPVACVLHLSVQSVIERSTNLGVLTLKDIYLFSAYTTMLRGVLPIKLEWFVDFPLHPRRTPKSVLLFISCYITHKEGLLAIAGNQSRSMGWRPQDCRNYRLRCYGFQLDYLARAALRAIIVVLLFLSYASIYLCYHWPWPILIPLNLVIISVPLGSFLAFISDFLPPLKKNKFIVTIHLTFGLVSIYLTWPSTFLPCAYHLFLLAAGLGGLVGTWTAWLHPWAPLLLPSIIAGSLCGLAVASAWRVMLPVATFFFSFMLPNRRLRALAAVGFTPLN